MSSVLYEMSVTVKKDGKVLTTFANLDYSEDTEERNDPLIGKMLYDLAKLYSPCG